MFKLLAKIVQNVLDSINCLVFSLFMSIIFLITGVTVSTMTLFSGSNSRFNNILVGAAA